MADGRFQNATEVVRGGLRMLEDYELARAINAAFDNPAADLPAEKVFAKREQQFDADKAEAGVTSRVPSGAPPQP
jgi:Arc/MetJ-type ribon-helix-helix transcriptional regulator